MTDSFDEVEPEEDDKGRDTGKGYTRKVFDYLVRERVRFYGGVVPDKHSLKSQYPPLQKVQEKAVDVVEQLNKEEGSTKNRRRRTTNIKKKSFRHEESMYDKSTAPPLPPDFLGIYKPRTIFEVFLLLLELRAMVISMPHNHFERIVQVQQDQEIPGLHLYPGNKLSKRGSLPVSTTPAPNFAKAFDKGSDQLQTVKYKTGAPTQSSVYHYLFFITTERAMESSKSKIIDAFENKMDDYIHHDRMRKLEEAALAKDREVET